MPRWIKDILYKLHILKAQKIVKKRRLQVESLHPKDLDDFLTEMLNKQYGTVFSGAGRTTKEGAIPTKPKVEDEFGQFNPDKVELNWCGCIVNKKNFLSDGLHLEHGSWEGDKLIKIYICQRRNIFKKIELTEQE